MRYFSTLAKRFKPVSELIGSPNGSLALAERLQELAIGLEIEEQKNLARQSSKTKNDLSVMVGTLYAGEAEFERCKLSVRAQTYKNYKQIFFEGLQEKEAVPAVLDRFLASYSDILFRLDADMVLTDKNFLSRVVDVFSAREDIFLLQMAIHDFFSNDVMQGINAYRQNMPLKKDAQDVLFPDRTGIDSNHRLVTWTAFAGSAIHCPDPSPFQAFHFGVHRGLKALQPNKPAFDAGNARQQMIYLEKTYDNFQARQDARLGFAALGFEQALTQPFELNHLNYANPYLKQRFAQIEGWDTPKIASEIELRRRTPALNDRIEPLRRQRRALLQSQRAPIESVIYLIPKLNSINATKALELVRAFNKEGVITSICLPDGAFKEYKDSNNHTTFKELNVLSFSKALKKQWDVVICSDCQDGAILCMPLFRTKLSAVYLGRGGGSRAGYISQVRATRPDVIFATTNSAREYKGLAPTVVPAPVDARLLLDILNLAPKDLEARIRSNHSIISQLVDKKEL